jgi:hypothetical protein
MSSGKLRFGNKTPNILRRLLQCKKKFTIRSKSTTSICTGRLFLFFFNLYPQDYYPKLIQLSVEKYITSAKIKFRTISRISAAIR